MALQLTCFYLSSGVIFRMESIAEFDDIFCFAEMKATITKVGSLNAYDPKSGEGQEARRQMLSLCEGAPLFRSLYQATAWVESAVQDTEDAFEQSVAGRC
ncbi:MAG TPA: hypothetical protein V6D27_01200 [Vampirovibrionales bacterium]